MSYVRRSILALLPLAFVLPGCLEDTSSQVYHASGEDGSFVLGFAYDGTGILPFDGFITVHADAGANTGDAVVKGQLNGQPWQILFDHFAQQPNKTFQDGGVAARLDEHGDTTHGDTSIPKVRVEVAGWGDAEVMVDNKSVKDPLTGEDRWVAHFMVITTGVRDDKTGAIWNADKSAPYDPKNPTNGLSVEGDNEIHLVLKSHATAPPNATKIDNKSMPFETPFVRTSHGYTNNFQNSEFNATIKVSGTYGPTQSLSFALRDPNNKIVKSIRLGESGKTEGQLRSPLNQTGKYVLEVSGSGLQAGYEITGAITPPSNVVMNFWWEDILLGEAAESFEATAGAG